jgi:hypothetical protein
MQSFRCPLALVILFIFSVSAFAQIEFEEAYYITQDGVKKQGLIKNLGWKKNPNSFQFKSSENEVPKVVDITEAPLFEIIGQLKYVRAEVPVDQSTDSRTQLGVSMVPEFETDTVFLKVVLEGVASLFELETEVNKRFYFQINNGEIVPLEYKKFFISSTEIRTNKTYQQQLANQLLCANTEVIDFEKIEYKKRALIAVFKSYHTCMNSEYIEYKGKKTKRLNISIGPRVYISTLEVTGSRERDFADFGSVTHFTFDIEVEAFLPFNNNQWSILFGVTPQRFSNTITNEFGTVSFDHSSINVPVGVRFNKYLNPQSRWYLQSGLILTMFGETDIQYDYRNGANDTVSKPGFSFATGYIFKDMINVQLEIEPRRQLFALATTFETMYRTASLSVSYQLPF